jgi:hypothetical protein
MLDEFERENKLDFEGKREREESAIWCMVVVLTKFPMCKTRILRLENLQIKGRERVDRVEEG